jgi:hypothetical protein
MSSGCPLICREMTSGRRCHVPLDRTPRQCLRLIDALKFPGPGCRGIGISIRRNGFPEPTVRLFFSEIPGPARGLNVDLYRSFSLRFFFGVKTLL